MKSSTRVCDSHLWCKLSYLVDIIFSHKLWSHIRIISQIYHRYDKCHSGVRDISRLSLFHSRHANNPRAPRTILAMNKERMDNAWPFAHTGCTLLASKAPLLPLKAPFEAICQMISRSRYSSVCYTCCILTVMQHLGEVAYSFLSKDALMTEWSSLSPFHESCVAKCNNKIRIRAYMCVVTIFKKLYKNLFSKYMYNWIYF